MNYLIVGASAVLGHQSIAAILQEDPQAFIIATSSGEAPIAGASQTIYGVDLQREDCAASMVAAIKARKIEAVVYVPARGAVGKPVEYATAEEYRASLNFSVVPMLKLMAALKPRLGLWFSGFMWLDCLLALYGPMIYTKITMEELTLRHPD
ncbi:MAG: hypothetical protein K1X75_14710, partial [Leptospirales bacterium]|nr:hypothetical protein [Leptospirales bacterium]